MSLFPFPIIDFGRIDGHGGHGNYFTCFDHDLNVMNHEVLQH